jgi:hypothetical protein
MRRRMSPKVRVYLQRTCIVTDFKSMRSLTIWSDAIPAKGALIIGSLTIDGDAPGRRMRPRHGYSWNMGRDMHER